MKFTGKLDFPTRWLVMLKGTIYNLDNILNVLDQVIAKELPFEEVFRQFHVMLMSPEKHFEEKSC